MINPKHVGRIYVLYGDPVAHNSQGLSVDSLQSLLGARINGDVWDGYVDFTERADPDNQKFIDSENTGVSDISYEPNVRFSKSVGKSSLEISMLSENKIPKVTDAVLFPEEAELEKMMLNLKNLGIKATIFGGGSSVTGGVSQKPADTSVSIDTSKLKSFEMNNRIAVIGGGMTGFQAENEAARRGLTLGFFPESFMHSSVAGWVSTMASGQESNRYGDIEDLVLGVEIVRSDGTIRDSITPRNSIGVSGKAIALGSEGRNGIISKVYFKTHKKTEERKYSSFFFKSFSDAIESVSKLDTFPDVLRISDSLETEIALSEAGSSVMKKVLDKYLGVRGFKSGCIAIAIDSGNSYKNIRENAAKISSTPAKMWEMTRFERPLVANLLWKSGMVVDTLETSVSWEKAFELYLKVKNTFNELLASCNIKGFIMSHMSHQYREGCCLYFSFVLNTPKKTEHLQVFRKEIVSAFLKSGGSLSHHHGIGTQLSGYLDESHTRLMEMLADPVLS